MPRPTEFRRRVCAWHQAHGRHNLPWRKTRNPYRILVSEVMLQQTQVARVLPKYQAFIRVFPSFGALARAPLVRVLKVWQGLGYNRRAYYLRELARAVVAQPGGRLPHGLSELEELPGLGPYTARAVMVLAWNQSAALVETNIRKVLLHEFFPGRRRVAEREIQRVAEQVLDKKRPREWNLSLMDYGAAHFSGPQYNPNRRSAAYAKQPKFAGSRRFVRGRIVALLTAQRSLSQAKMFRALKSYHIPRATCVAALDSLVADGLVEVRKAGYRLIR